MKNGNFINIQGWMVNDLHLSGNELILYALIFGFSQDGESEYYGSQSYMAESLGITRESVQRTIKRLEDKGLIIKVSENNLFKGKIKYKAVYISDEKSHDDVTKHHNVSDEISHNNIDDNIDDKRIEDKSSKKEEVDNFVDMIYKMYPSNCPKRKKPLGKSIKDKARIRNLLKIYTMDDIKRVVEYEIDTKYNKDYMSNFSTFLNNFPDPNFIDVKDRNDMGNKKGNLTIGGVEYK